MKTLALLLLASASLFAQPRIWPETTDPSAPAAGFQTTFASANHGVCTIDSNGTKTCPVVASGANAAKADALTTARALWGNNFDGTAAITAPITGTYGGTGVNNGASTITLGGNFATSGANSLILTTTGSTNVTLPTTGTLLAGTSNDKIRPISASFVNGGSVIAATESAPFTVPFGCTIAAYNITLAPSGTATFKVWKKATGTAIPTVSDSINTSGVAISTGTAIHSTTTSDFTSTAVTANDIFIVSLTAVTGSPTSANLTLQCNVP